MYIFHDQQKRKKMYLFAKIFKKEE